MIKRNDKQVISLSVDGQEVYLVTNELGEIVYKKPDTKHDGIILYYKDSTKASGKNFKEYTIEQTTPNLDVVSDKYPYQTIQPYSETVADKQDILSFTDTTNEITCLSDWCFFECTNLTSINCPGVKELKLHSIESCNNLTYVNLSELTSYSAYNIVNTNLKKMFVDSSIYKSIGNGFGEEDQLISSLTIPGRLVSIVSKATQLSNDNITTLGAYACAYNIVISAIYLWNLSGITNSVGDEFFIDINLSDIYIDNSVWKSIPENENESHRNVLVTADGHTLVGILPYNVKFLQNNNITSINNNAFYRSGSLLSIDINNDYFETNDDYSVLYSKDMKSIYVAVKGKTFTDSIFDEVETIMQGAFENTIFDNSSVIDLGTISCINENAFQSASILSVTADSLTNLDGGANFYGSALKSFSSNSLLEIKTGSNFSQYTVQFNLTGFTAPNLSSITGSCTFQNQGALSSIYLPNLETMSGTQIFYSCINLSTVNLPKCTTFGDETFKYCAALAELTCTSLTKQQVIDMKDRVCIPSGCKCTCSDGEYVIP